MGAAGQPCCRWDRKCRPGISYKMVYCQGIYFRLKDVSEWAHERGILWYPTLHHPEAASFVACHNVLLKVQLKHMLRGDTLQ